MSFAALLRTIGIAAAGLLASLGVALAADQSSDADWVSLTGAVAGSESKQFVIRDGAYAASVQMKDWVWYNSRSKLPDGEVVTVYGKMAEAADGTATVQASSIYVHDRNTFYFAEDSNKEVGYTLYAHVADFDDGKRVNVAGLVISKEGRDMAIDTGSDVIAIDTRSVIDDKFDNARFEMVEPGDVIAVSGFLDGRFLDQRHIEARTILPVVLRDREDVFLSIKTSLVAPTRG